MNGPAVLDSPAMTRRARLAALVLAVVFAAAPAAAVCGELGPMPAGCPMATMAANTGAGCHEAAAPECCGVESAPEPIEGSAAATAVPAAGPEALALPGAVYPELDAPAPRAATDGPGLHALGRYTLFAAFLL